MADSSRGIREQSRWAMLHTDPCLEAQRIELMDGQVVYEPLAAATDLYFIESGQVRTYEGGPDGSARLLEILGPGDWCGEAALATAKTHSARAIAVSPTVLCIVSVEKLMALLRREPDAAAELIHQLATRLQNAREDGNRLVFDDCNARLVKTLLRFSQTAAATQEQDGVITLRITHRQLAQAVGAARETVSLALTELRQKKLIRTGRNRLVFRPDALHALSGDTASFAPHDGNGKANGNGKPNGDGNADGDGQAGELKDSL